MIKVTKVSISGNIEEFILLLKDKFPDNEDNWEHYAVNFRAFQQSLAGRNVSCVITVEAGHAVLYGTKQETELIAGL